MHPILVSTGYQAQIKMQALKIPLSIPFLLNGEVYIPFVDRLNDGKTPFTYPLFGINGRNNGQLLSNLIPALLGSTEGSVLYPGEFDPGNMAYLQNDRVNNPGYFTTSGEMTFLDNPVSGPSVTNPDYSIEFFPTANSPYTVHTFHSILNQPEIQYTGQCLRNAQYFNDFNNTLANPFMTEGTVRLSSGTLLSFFFGLPKSLAGTYNNIYGYTAPSQTVGFPLEDCQVAANNVDPKASA